MRAGAHDCVARPVEAPMLAVRIAELARRHGRSRMLPEGSVLPANITDAAAPRRASPGRAADVAAGAAHHRGGDRQLFRQHRPRRRRPELSPSTIYRKRQAWAETEGKRGAPDAARQRQVKTRVTA